MESISQREKALTLKFHSVWLLTRAGSTGGSGRVKDKERSGR